MSRSGILLVSAEVINPTHASRCPGPQYRRAGVEVAGELLPKPVTYQAVLSTIGSLAQIGSLPLVKMWLIGRLPPGIRRLDGSPGKGELE